ncbi:hypothetical protein [Arthrobacter sp. 3Tela_A]|uniref:hypothetical protein n=1 Tax=Arthrobacter sp. 3Tela_A TaxID=3093743 RepID=UPI003BB64111
MPGKSTPKGPAPGAAAMDTSATVSTSSLNAVSLQDYEALVSIREAFVNFLLGEPAAAV